MAAAVLSVARARRRLRHRRLPRYQSRFRHDAGFPPLHAGGEAARAARHHRTGHQPHVRPAPLVQARRRSTPDSTRATGTSGATPTRDTTARGSSSPIPRNRTGPGIPEAGAYYWHRFFSHQPDLNFDNPRVRQRHRPGDEALARCRRRRIPAGCHSLSVRARGHQQREPPETHAIIKKIRAELDAYAPGKVLLAEANQWPEDVQRLFRRRRRMPHGLSFSADAAHLHGDRAGGPLSDHRHPAADAGHSGQLPMGDVPAQSRRADAGNGDRRRARLSVVDLRRRSARAHQSRHPPAAGAADGQRSAQDRVDELAADVVSGHADHLLRRRDRHGRQHLSRRPQRRAHADAVDARPQRRLLALRSGAALAADRSWTRFTAMRRSTSRRSRAACLAAELDQAADSVRKSSRCSAAAR